MKIAPGLLPIIYNSSVNITNVCLRKVAIKPIIALGKALLQNSSIFHTTKIAVYYVKHLGGIFNSKKVMQVGRSWSRLKHTILHYCSDDCG